MKKFLVAGCLLIFAFMASAQGGQGGQRGGQRTPEQQAQRYERMKTTVGLNDKQIADIKKIDEEFAPKLRELREKYPNDREKMQEERTKLTNQQNEKVKPLLTAEQYTKYVEFVRQGPGQRGQGGGGNRRNN